MSAIIGIDPGVMGAVAVYFTDRDTTSPRAVIAHDTPTVHAKRGKSALDVDAHAFGLLLDIYAAGLTVVEHVHSRPRQAGQFAFGTNYGRILGVLESRGLKILHAAPSKWKQDLGLRGEDKSQSVALAAALFPGCASQFYGPRGAGLDGRAEAALLAYWGSKQ